MTQAECVNGHIYDSDIYDSCPYCSNQVKEIRLTPSDLNGEKGDSPKRGTVAPGQRKTVPPRDYGNRMTIARRGGEQAPVVGWIVCVEGVNKGKDYHLFAKVNTIGRSDDADICIEGDMTVSRLQMKITYDKRHNQFWIAPGDNTNNSYLNDQIILSQQPLTAYDLIEFGEDKTLGIHKFRFVPFCSDQFQWESD